MTKYRIAIVAVALWLLLAAVPAQAESLTFSFSGGLANTIALGNKVITNDPLVAGTVHGVAQAQVSTLNLIEASTGVIFNGDLGTFSFFTGSFIGYDPANPYTMVMNPGGAITILANEAFEAMTGIAAGTVLFSGQFVGNTLWTQLDCFENCTGPITYILTGPVSGTVNPALLALLGLNGDFHQLTFNLQMVFTSSVETKAWIETGSVNLAAPEPGTLTLFGAGLLGLAGAVRRRRQARVAAPRP